MRKKVLKYLKCPNTKNSDFYLIAIKDYNVLEMDELDDDFDINKGVLFSYNFKFAYPIKDYVLKFLSDEDVDLDHYLNLLVEIKKEVPQKYKLLIDLSIERVNKRKETSNGKWNREEMEYYDKDIITDVNKNEIIKELKNKPIWDRFITRKRYLIKYIEHSIKNKNILEIGCGNSRTINWILNPQKYKYNYFGVDISWERVKLAKKIIPEGEFFQASAITLPLNDQSIDVIIAFGVIHHLSDQITCIKNISTILKNGGYFLFHEPMKKKKLFDPDPPRWILKIFKTYEHSKHDNVIDFIKINDVLSKCSINGVKVKYTNSIFRSMLITLVQKVFFLRNIKSIYELISLIDSLLVKSICKIFPRLGPGAVFYFGKKC